MSGNSAVRSALNLVVVLQAAAIVWLLLQPAPSEAVAGDAPPAGAAALPAQLRAEATREAPLARAAAPRESVVAASAGALVFGAVRDDAGQPLRGGQVWFSRGDAAPFANASLGRGISEFALAGQGPGAITYRARVDGHQQVTGRIDVPAGMPRVRHDIVVPKTWLLQVRLDTAQGQPLAAALAARPDLQQVEVTAVATLAPPAGDLPPTLQREATYGVGRWLAATGLGAAMRRGPRPQPGVHGTLEIDVRQRVFVSAVLRHRVLATAVVEPGQAELTLPVELAQVLTNLGALAGRVVDAATGAPVAGAKVSLDDATTFGPGITSDAAGRFAARDLRPGWLRLQVRAGALASQADVVAVAAGETLDLGDVPVFGVRRIEGRCENLQGKPQSCRVTYQSLDAPSHPALRRRRDGPMLRADGSFTLEVPEGRYHLWVLGAGGALHDLDTRAQGSAPLVLQLAQEARLRLTAAPDAGVWEMQLHAGERQLTSETLFAGQSLPLSLPLGRYRVELLGAAGQRFAREFALGRDGLDLRVPFD